MLSPRLDPFKEVIEHEEGNKEEDGQNDSEADDGGCG